MAESCGTVVVEPAFEESAVSASCDVKTGTITEGEDAEVGVDVTNDNDDAADVEVDLLVDDSRVESVSMTVSGGSSDSEDFVIADLGEGEHSIDVELASVSEA